MSAHRVCRMPWTALEKGHVLRWCHECKGFHDYGIGLGMPLWNGRRVSAARYRENERRKK